MTADVSNKVKEENKELIEKHPYLLPRDFLGNKIENYNYEFTYLDDMPQGWRAAFGGQMCNEITEFLKAHDFLYQYRVVQIKEKFGELRWYDNGGPDGLYDIIGKYEILSGKTCICCGDVATKYSTGWISPYCEKCANNLSTKYHIKFHDGINPLYDFDEGGD